MAPTAPTNSLTLRYAGDNGSPLDAFPLGECEGDCDSDNDCEVSVNIPMILKEKSKIS